MPRYIDAEKFVEWIDAGHLRSASEICLSENNVLKMIELQPTADVVEVKHGEWKVITFNTSDAKYIRCSACNSVIDSNFTYINENEFDFCPYCGAKMDGKQHKDATMLSDREKLINLMSSAGWNLFTDDQSKEQLADFLIANGVMVKMDCKLQKGV